MSIICPQRALGNSNEYISAIGLGTVKLGRNQQVKYPTQFELPDDRAVTELLHHAQALGLNLIDTAPAYGISEQRLGKLLPGKRSDWHLMTKAGEAFVDGQSMFDFTPTAIQASVERSLRYLKTDYLDTVLIHSNGDDVALIEQMGVLAVLAELKQKGLVRFTGMSTKTVAGGLLALAQADAVMVSVNANDTSQLPVLAAADESSKIVYIKKFLASGHQCQAEHVKAAFQQVFAHQSVASVIIGTINSSHLTQNVQWSINN